MYEDMGSEAPAFLLMKDYVSKIEKNDAVFYFHCKGSSKKSDKENSNYQDTLLSKVSIGSWVDHLSFFLIDRVQEYTYYLDKYGSLCLYPTRHLFGNDAKSGTLGNFWWCSGLIANGILDINLTDRPRHFFEINVLNEMIIKSKNSYTTSWYIHDGSLHTYTTDSKTLSDIVNGYWNKSLTNIINIEMPFDSNNISTVIINKGSSRNTIISQQRFKNFIVCDYTQPIPDALVYILFTNGELDRDYPDYWLDNLLKKLKTTYTGDFKCPFIMDNLTFHFNKETLCEHLTKLL